jgi:hypothetical protein
VNLLYLKKFNNYYNKRVKYYSDIEEYINNCEDYSYNAGVDFNPGDNINTVKVANLSSLHFSPDYLLVLEENDSKAIVSRWFVMEMKRERNGQYTVQLRRDLIADYFEQLKTSPMLVLKGNLQPNSPLIYNRENISVNQIKKDEIALKDFTDTSWIVGYIANDSFTESQQFEVVNSGELNTVPSIESLGITLKDSTEPEQGGYIHQIPNVKFKYKYRSMDTWFGWGVPVICEYNYTDNIFTNFSEVANSTEPSIDVYGVHGAEGLERMLNAYKTAFNNRKQAIINGLDAYFDGEQINVVDTEDYSEIYALNGKVVRSNQTGLYYKLTIGKGRTETTNKLLSSQNPTELSLYQAAMSAIQNTATAVEGEYYYREKDCVGIEYTDTITDIVLSPLPGAGYAKVNITSGHKLLEDAPYSMFCLRNTPINLNLAIKIAEKLDKKCYDLQLLPYCPVPTKIEMDHGIPYPNGNAIEENDFFNIFDDKDEKLDYIFFATTSQGSFVIDKQISVPLDPVGIKVANDCDTYRLCSPNYNGIFEFNATKNGGVDYFEVSYTYKPYSPYIHVNPNFKNLYGSDFNDARGLICGGDFSLPRTTDAWETFQLQNKNYLNIFDREIETMDQVHTYDLWSGGISAAAGAVGAGFGMGALMNPGIGLLAGGLSAGGGIVDVIFGDKKYNLNKQLSIDKFNMNLQNIRALPTSLSKVGAYNIDNKVFPFLEYYTCTDTEKDTYKKRIKYEAMTVNAIGTLEEYIDEANDYNFFSASPIILDDIADDYHLATAIAEELQKGVYL